MAKNRTKNGIFGTKNGGNCQNLVKFCSSPKNFSILLKSSPPGSWPLFLKKLQKCTNLDFTFKGKEYIIKSQSTKTHFIFEGEKS